MKLTWGEVRSRLSADRRRLRQTVGENTPLLSLHPSYLCVALYRTSNYLWRRNHALAARLVWQTNFFLTGADISPAADLGEGLLILSPAGVSIMGRAGRNLTVMPCAGLGGEMGSLQDIGAGPGLPLLEDDIVLEPHCGVLGPVHVGSRVRVGAGVGLTKDVPDDSVIEGPAPRFPVRRSAA
jgi:serine O-acetyltransferase